MGTARVSVVDDDQSVRESLASLCRSVGLGVKVFASAEEFLGSNEIQATDCLLLDMRMPGIDGLELQSRLNVSHPDLPVVFITAHGSGEELRRRALDRGAVGYLLKPLSEDEVLSAIETALNPA